MESTYIVAMIVAYFLLGVWLDQRTGQKTPSWRELATRSAPLFLVFFLALVATLWAGEKIPDPQLSAAVETVLSAPLCAYAILVGLRFARRFTAV